MAEKQLDSVDPRPRDMVIFSIESLRKATNNFSEENKICGSSYFRAILEDGSIAAVTDFRDNKSLWIGDEGDDEAFWTVVDAVSGLKHPNVAGFIGFCVEKDRRIVVCEYGDGHNLHELLSNQLDWRAIVSICLGIGHGLEYFFQRVFRRPRGPRLVLGGGLKSWVVAIVDNNYIPKVFDLRVSVNYPCTDREAKKDFGSLLHQVITRSHPAIPRGPKFFSPNVYLEANVGRTRLEEIQKILEIACAISPELGLRHYVPESVARIPMEIYKYGSLSHVLAIISKDFMPPPPHAHNSSAVKTVQGGGLLTLTTESEGKMEECQADPMERKSTTQKTHDLRKAGEQLVGGNTSATYVTLFSLKSLKEATNNFSDGTRIAESSFFKAFLENRTIAILQDPAYKMQDYDFMELVQVLSRLKHSIVAEFIGICVEGGHRIIIYEFKGPTLKNLLFDYEVQVRRSWAWRASICLGIARGLDQFYQETSLHVKHHLCPEHVFIQDKYIPKIVFTHVNLCSDPWKPDCKSCMPDVVQNLGFLLIEMITGRMRSDYYFRRYPFNSLQSFVEGLHGCGKALDFVDPLFNEFPEDEVMRFIDVAILCFREPLEARPSLSQVFLMLSADYDMKRIIRKPEIHVHDQMSGEEEMIQGCAEPVSSMQSHLHASTPASKTASLSSVSKGKEKMAFDIEQLSDPESDYVQEEIMQSPRDLQAQFKPNMSVSASSSVPLTPLVDPVPKGKGIIAYKVEQTSDPEADYSKEEEIQSPHGPQAESKPKISAPVSDPVPVDKNAVNPELVGTSSKAGSYRSTELDISAHISIPGACLETPADPPMAVTASAKTRTSVHNEAIKWVSSQEEFRQGKESLSPSKVYIDRPVHSTIEKILEALRDAQHRRICLYGSGGSGKTTVLKTLSRHPAARELFDMIIFLSIPLLAYRREIQNQMIQQLSLNVVDSDSEDETAAQIRNAFTGSSRKVLLLLDDVCNIMNLHEFGIPIPSVENECWLLLATRSLDVCCNMADRMIEMEVLSTVEAWKLFSNQVGDVANSLEIEPYAQAIAKECDGLPLIISAVASSLKMETTVVEWKLALRGLQLSKTCQATNMCSASPHIKYCYDRLKVDDAKACFLYCALFANDEVIDVSALVDCFIDEGLFGGRTLTAYERGHGIVRHLVNILLLDATADEHKVKMHNYMSDTALDILSSTTEGHRILTGFYLRESPVPKSKPDEVQSNIVSPNIHKYLARAGTERKERPALEEWEQATMIFLMDSGSSNLPSKLSCPALEGLFLQRNSYLTVIPASFFDSMCGLRILNLSKTRIRSLPDSFSKLRSLKVLLLRYCERLSKLPQSIGCLKALEVLDLEGTELTHLVDSVGELASLKHLLVSFYGSVYHRECSRLPTKLVPDGVISKLDLRELGIFVYPGDRRWTSGVSNIIKEVSSLNLSALYFHFPDEEDLGHFLGESKSWKQGNLATFSFIVGHDFKHAVSQVSHDAEMMHDGEKRCLRFVNGKNIPSPVQEVLSGATSFYLDHHVKVCSLSDFGIQAINALKICILRNCPSIRAIVHDDESSKEVLPFLEYISINHLWNLKSIWVGQVAPGSLAMLRHLSIQACPNLKFVFFCSMLHALGNLEELVIEDCEFLEYVTIEDDAIGDDTGSRLEEKPVASEISIITSGTPALPSLKVLKLHYLPKLRGIWKGGWPTLKYISFYDCPKLRNLHMEAKDVISIEEIAVDEVWWEALDWDDPMLPTNLDDRVTQIDIDHF